MGPNQCPFQAPLHRSSFARFQVGLFARRRRFRCRKAQLIRQMASRTHSSCVSTHMVPASARVMSVCLVTLYQRIAKGAGGKGPRQKTSKIAKKCQKVFRHFSTIFTQGKKRQKSSKNVKNNFDTFRQFSRGTSFPAPFGGL